MAPILYYQLKIQLYSKRGAYSSAALISFYRLKVQDLFKEWCLLEYSAYFILPVEGVALIRLWALIQFLSGRCGTYSKTSACSSSAIISFSELKLRHLFNEQRLFKCGT